MQIPKGWLLKKIGDIADITAGGTPSTLMPSFWGGSIPWMNSGELNLKNVRAVAGRITKAGLENSSTKLIKKHAVLVGLAGQGKTRGTAAINEIDLCINQSIGAIQVRKGNYYKYVYYNIDNRYFELRQLSFGDGGRGGLNISLLEGLKIFLPPLNEQINISAILSDFDSAIEKTEQLIQVKVEYKRGIMHKLLKGDGKYKKLKNKHEIYKLKNLIKEVSERNLVYKINLVLSVTNSYGFRQQSDHFDKIVASKDLGNYKIVRKGQFGYNPSRVNVGSIARLEDYEAGLLSPMYIIFETDETKLLPEYMKYFIQTWAFNGQVDYLTQGSVRDSLAFDSLEQIEIYLPSIDKELDLLKQKADLLKFQKKGLMQQLLTGKIRVKTKRDKKYAK